MNASLSTGQQLAIFGAQLAADHADRVTGGNWTADAWDFFIGWAKAQQGKTFQGEEARQAANGLLPEPPEPRAWGAIVMRAAKAGLIVRVGYAPVKDPRSHHSPKSVWVWRGGHA